MDSCNGFEALFKGVSGVVIPLTPIKVPKPMVPKVVFLIKFLLFDIVLD